MCKSLLLFLIVSPLGSMAQTNWKLGIGLGLNSSSIRFKGFDNSSEISPNLGFIAEKNFNRRFALITELNYFISKSNSGLNHLPNGLPVFFKQNITISYLDFPVLFSYNFVNRNRFNVSSGLGIAFKYAIESSADAEAIRGTPTGFYSYRDINIDMSKSTNLLLICPTFQSAFAYQLKNSRSLQFSIRYSFSVNDPVRSGLGTQSEFTSDFAITFPRNSFRAFSWLLQYQFPLVTN